MHNYSVFYRKVKNLRIEVSKDDVKIIVPLNYPHKIENLINKYERWIKEKREKLKEIEDISKKLRLYNHENLEGIVKKIVEDYSKILKVKPERIVFRKMKNRWGSCHFSNKKLIFNKKLRFLPLKLIEYVVLHEMCHLIFKNHKKQFWNLIKKIEPQYLQKEKLLAGYKILTP
jgi:predicted metal-dependent hydrolase